jgi:hypothetical protein
MRNRIGYLVVALLALALVTMARAQNTPVFSGPVNFQAGPNETPPVNVPANGKIQSVEIVFDADPFPVGDTNIVVFLSNDGGLTYPPERSFPITWTAPHNFGKLGHFVNMLINLSRPEFIANKAKARVTAPAAFTTNVTISVGAFDPT